MLKLWRMVDGGRDFGQKDGCKGSELKGGTQNRRLMEGGAQNRRLVEG